jgi:flagellar biosynthesis protein FlhG
MFNHNDQADGLRRIMASSSARVISVMSANGQPATAWLNNLAASMVNPEKRTLLIQAIQKPATKYSLHSVALRKSVLSRSIVKHPQGYDLASLAENSTLTSSLSDDVKAQLDGIVNQLAFNYDTVMMEAQLDPRDNTFILPSMAQHELVIQMERNEEAIKSAYVMIKRISQQYGQLPLNVMVTGSTQEQGQQYFMRLNQVCEQFLGVALSFLGAIPEMIVSSKTTGDKNKNGLDTSPAAQSALAFKAIAKSLEKQRLATPSLAAA